MDSVEVTGHRQDGTHSNTSSTSTVSGIGVYTVLLIRSGGWRRRRNVAVV